MLALLSLALPFRRGHSLQQQQANEVPPKKSARLVQPSEQFDVGNLAVSNTTDDLARELQAAIANASSCNASTYVPNDCRCWMWSTPQTDACAAAEDPPLEQQPSPEPGTQPGTAHRLRTQISSVCAVAQRMAARKPPQQRLVLALDCDCFYAQCETRRDPSLAGKPVGVRQKHLVITSNYAARAFGIRKGDSLAEVKRSSIGWLAILEH